MSSDEIVDYVTQIGTLGEKISNISNEFFNTQTINESNVSEKIRLARLGLAEYTNILNSLNRIIPPDIINIEHTEMVDEFKRFIVTTNSMFDVNCDLAASELIAKFSDGVKLQERCVKNTSIICDKIADKLCK